jgi:flagellar hook assembly protein FlgD
MAPGLAWDLGILPPGTQGSILITLTINALTEGTTLVNSAQVVFENASAPGTPVTLNSSLVRAYVGSPDLFIVDRNALNSSQGQILNIRLGASMGGRVSLRIYNSSGELIRTLLDREAPGSLAWNLVWDGRNDNGDLAASGVYLIRFSGPRLTETRRLVIIR